MRIAAGDAEKRVSIYIETEAFEIARRRAHKFKFFEPTFIGHLLLPIRFLRPIARQNDF